MIKHWMILGLVMATAAGAWAVMPKQWEQKTEADFAEAELDSTVVTSYGRIELSRATDRRAELSKEQTVIHDAVARNGALYLAAGPKGWLLKADATGQNVKTVHQYEGRQVFAIASGKAGLWVAISGEKSTQLELRGDDDAVVKTIDVPETRYIWDMLIHDGTAYLATGTEGKVLAIALNDEKPAPRTLLDTEQDNVLCLGHDGQGRIYTGTDGEGLVYRLTPPAQGESDWSNYVLYDAKEPEIGALLVEADGTVFAGTADAKQAKPGRQIPPAEKQTGQPEKQPDDKKTDETKKPDEKPDEAAKPDEAVKKPDETPKAPAKPTAEQFDKLREEIKKRLAEAKKAGKLSVKAGGINGKPRVSRTGKKRPASAASADKGNAVYRIDAEGFVREMFRESVMILRLVKQNGRLLIATGNEGQLYQVELADQQSSVLVDLQVKQIPTMLALADGTLLLGTAHPAEVIHVNGGFARTGTFTSDVLDAEQISLWGKLRVLAEPRDQTSLTIETRSGNVGDPKAGSWSAWSQAQTVAPEQYGDPVYLEVQSPPARFLQYRLTLSGDGKVGPSVDAVALKYLMPNLKPRIVGIVTEYDVEQPSEKDPTPRPTTKLKIAWKADDANEDKLQYKLELRKAGDDDGPWLTLAEELKKPEYEWNTRRAENGRYILRVTADDARDNTPDQAHQARRLSAIVTVDNEAPRIANLRIAPGPQDGQASVSAALSDALSDIKEVRYSVNGGSDWQAVLPEDRIYDSTNETVSFKIPDLAPGAAVITLRVLDAQQNAAYASRAVNVPGKAD